MSSFLWDWFSSILNYFGLWNKSGKILFLGLDNAGKTSLLQRLKSDSIAQNVPTLHATSQELTIKNLRFTAIDIGGHFQARRVWRDYFMAVDVIVFLVDSQDTARLMESKYELDQLLADEQIQNCPILILGNKIDMPGSIGEGALIHSLGLYGRTTGKDHVSISTLQGRRPLELFMCSIKERQGYGEAFNWVSQYL